MSAAGRRLPSWTRPYLFAALQALVTTGVSTFIATGAGARWLGVWSLSWVTIIPIVLLQAPLLGRIVNQCCDAGAGTHLPESRDQRRNESAQLTVLRGPRPRSKARTNPRG